MLELHIQEASIVSSSVMWFLFYQGSINTGSQTVSRVFGDHGALEVLDFICVLVKKMESGIRLLRKTPVPPQSGSVIHACYLPSLYFLYFKKIEIILVSVSWKSVRDSNHRQ